MRIWYQFPRPASGAEGFRGRLEANWSKVGNPDTSLDIKAPVKGTADFRYSIVGHMYADMLRTVEIVEGITQAARDGYDGAVIGCFGDPGLDVLEAMIDIPVVGPAKASLIMGQAVGRRMGFVTLPHWEKKVEKLICAYGLEHMLIAHRPCRAFTLPLEKFADEEQVLENFNDVAEGLIQDGADVISLGCLNCSTLLTYKGVVDVRGFPVVDGAIAALKLVEVLVEFKKAGFWKSMKSIQDEIIEGLRKGYYHGSESK